MTGGSEGLKPVRPLHRVLWLLRADMHFAHMQAACTFTMQAPSSRCGPRSRRRPLRSGLLRPLYVTCSNGGRTRRITRGWGRIERGSTLSAREVDQPPAVHHPSLLLCSRIYAETLTYVCLGSANMCDTAQGRLIGRTVVLKAIGRRVHSYEYVLPGYLHGRYLDKRQIERPVQSLHAPSWWMS